MYLYVKRFFDIFFASLVIIVLLPLLVVLIPLMKLTGEGYLFYYQQRIGFKNRPFAIIKFATMLKNSPNIGTGLITLRGDARVTPMGKFLRPTKLNELPQLLNVIKGDMSFVGPRPLVDKTFEPYSDYVKANIYNVIPGITGGAMDSKEGEPGPFMIQGDHGPIEYRNIVVTPVK